MLTTKSIRKIVFGVLVAGSAILVGSAFTTKAKSESSIALVSLMPNPSSSGNWIPADPGNCDPGPELCAISFDTDRYPLENENPSQAVLNILSADDGETGHGQEIGSTGIVVYKKK